MLLGRYEVVTHAKTSFPRCCYGSTLGSRSLPQHTLVRWPRPKVEDPMRQNKKLGVHQISTSVPFETQRKGKNYLPSQIQEKVCRVLAQGDSNKEEASVPIYHAAKREMVQYISWCHLYLVKPNLNELHVPRATYWLLSCCPFAGKCRGR